ncbi:pyridoxine 5'-phosphate synthase [uncultured Salinisphaera sp.]|uniref:pyridoxine 5'-phosphate synthase n=1 Tax=uncultured Salinisphaera sp. TaxID=359372 RepID=UPI0032B1647B|tara:strand:- start:6312 stop:7073 length:762 start_codon:yes stop_codon:yes gene_type:complete
MTDLAAPAPPIRLGVNVDHVATLRQARGTSYPDVAAAARLAMDSGAASITIHLREDRRHIQDHDVETLCAAPDMPINLEMALTDEMLEIACRLRPRDCCLVPESREELTTEGGLDIAGQQARVADGIQRLQAAGIAAALFIDPDVDQIHASAEAGAHHIELHTGAYADAADSTTRRAELARIVEAAELAESLGIEVHAGHGLHVDNVGEISAIAPIVELNIGHALIARAVFVGLGEAIVELSAAMAAGRRQIV